ncbi:YihY/virulence factor BrkB family protein [Actinacidiphila epipremni]|jgi:membrane protein|uniref:YihY/virulence factor BrkB family protein n=1 Tax=Actinacidiphila epipremni TaxID=2053013 RepID=A0ABX0ZJY0_9ACTN|nr:YihY/virulence factor BrkB family protein [Actinacidiphila epipremni]NJP42762.1 YihY/virulence factor BrkB family protein [Actinacidiphila epipremni]
MDWLTRVPWIGPRLGPWYERRVAPLVARVMRTHAYRAFDHLLQVHWTRLAAAMTFTSFLSLFPLITVAAAVGAALLSQRQLDRLEDKLTDQIPGIADQIDIHGLVDNAGTVGLIASGVLLFTGIGWVSSLRDCLRAVWGKDDSGENPVKGKLHDFAILVGLGLAVLVSLGASGFATTAVTWTADRIGLAEQGWGRVALTVVGYLLAVTADFLILIYLLTFTPGVDPPRQAVVMAALIGAVGLEILKVALSGYLQRVAGRNIYGAFGTPVALLLWFNFMAKLLLYCAAWTVTPRHAPEPLPPHTPPEEHRRGATRWEK